MIYMNLLDKIKQIQDLPSRSTCSGQNTLSYLTPTVWNNLHTCLKLSNTLNSFKHGVKEHFFEKLKNKELHIFAY